MDRYQSRHRICRFNGPDGEERTVGFLNEGRGGTGIITGNVWRDVQNNGIKAPEEMPLCGWTIFIDLSQDNVLNPDEPFEVTDGEGNDTFTGSFAGGGTSSLDH